MGDAVDEATTLYRQLGGYAVVAVIVDTWTQALVADIALARFFVDLDLERLRNHQVAFFNVVFGGPQRYHGRDLREAHAGLGLTAEHCRLAVAHLAATLRLCAIPAGPGAALLARVAALADELVAPQSTTPPIADG